MRAIIQQVYNYTIQKLLVDVNLALPLRGVIEEPPAVFAAGLPGRNGQSPNAEQVDLALQKMVQPVRSGMLESFLALDKSGEALQFV